MNKNAIKAVVLTVALTFSSVGYVDAKRMGSGKNIGQSAPVQKQAQPAQAQKPAQQAQPAAPAAGNAAAAAPKRPGFGGMLGGLAAGLGIAYLLSHFGLGEAAASFFTGLLIALAVGLLLLFILKRFMPSMSGAGRTSPATAANNGMQRTAYEHGNTRNEPGFVPVAASFGGAAAVVPEVAKSLPEGFDEYAFLDNAKHYFVKLQKAWDDGDLNSLREFATPEMFSNLTQDLNARAEASNQTDVVSLNAELLGIETGQDNYLASIQFTGMIREQAGASAEPFTEIWNLSKPIHGAGGWVLAGIQQLV